MRQLLPTPADIDPAAAQAAAERPTPPDRPWIIVNMVSSADGATALEGRSANLGGKADREVFSTIRAVADVIVAGAGAVRSDEYGPPKTSATRRAEREARGQTPYPRLGVVTRSLDLDPTSSFFTEAPERPIVYTVASADPDKVARFAEVAEVVQADGDDVTASTILDHLQGLGTKTLLVEGGPTVNGFLLEADVIDELALTIAPALVGGDSHRAVVGAPEKLRRYRLAHLWEQDSELLARYVRA